MLYINYAVTFDVSILGVCKEDISCSSNIRARSRSPTPYHASFSGGFHSIAHPNEHNGYNIAQELAKYVPAVDVWTAAGPEYTRKTFPDRSKIGLYTNSFYKKNHPIQYNQRIGDGTTLHVSKDDIGLMEVKRSLLNQFKELSKHYHGMRNLVSHGLDDGYGSYDDEEGSNGKVIGKRKDMSLDNDSAIRLGRLGSEKIMPWRLFKLLGHVPWAEDT